MKERPILFSNPMVRAILGGNKTQTRREVKDVCQYACLTGDCDHLNQSECNEFMKKACPYGVPGDRLWVREAVSFSIDGLPLTKIPTADQKDAYPRIRVWYMADNDRPTWAETKWTPSIHMPRWAARIRLDITDIRVEALDDISEIDALAEGCESTAEPTEDGTDYTGRYAYENYADLWESINGKDTFDDRLVWVIKFNRVTT